MVKHDKLPILARLDQWLAGLPDVATVEDWLASAGVDDARVDVEEFSLLFKSAREFFFAPVVEYGPLPDWKAIAGTGQELQDVFWYIKEAIDAYFGDRAFEVTIRAGCLSGKKGEQAAAILAAAEEPESLTTGEVMLVEADDADLSEGDEPAVEEILETEEAEELDAFRRARDDGTKV